MATLVFTALGTAIGGPLGGAIGALVGRQIDGAIFGAGSREGPRLKELSVTTSSYGTALPRHFGQMRVSGSIIWATDLAEHRESSGGGKGKPSVTTYSYTASFAVALGSRPIARIGRIWADGNLLRGAAGDLKVGGEFRFHAGHGDQQPDALLAAAEGTGLCPAYRGLAYVVFQDLQLADFGNRIPALTFEIFADDGPLDFGQVVEGVIDNVETAVALPGISGLYCEGPLSEVLAQLAPVIPVDCDVSGSLLTLDSSGGSVIAELREATVTTADDGFGGESGYSRKRLPPNENPPEILRYYDIARDYQPGLQRILGRPASGQPNSIELPVAADAASAREMVEGAARRASWARQTISWRTSEIDPLVRPGAVVKVPGQVGRWRVNEWEWRASGVELTLLRLAPVPGAASAGTGSDAGRPLTATDAALGVSELVAFEAPWDGTGTGDTALVYAAASSASAGWTGAALFLDAGDGQLLSLGTSGRTRSVMGHAISVLEESSPHLFDRRHSVIVELLDASFTLQDASARQMGTGSNRALLGQELIQFAAAVPLGGGVWRLEGLLRGRGGTEDAIGGHAAGEPFVLMDSVPVALDGAIIGSAPSALIAAIGVGDADPVCSAIYCRGLTRRPLFPVHPRVNTTPDGGRLLGWTRRARGAWEWLDGVATPLHEEAEAYDVFVGPDEQPLAVWSVTAAELALSGAQWGSLCATYPGAPVCVRQRGSYAVSRPLLLTHLT